MDNVMNSKCRKCKGSRGVGGLWVVNGLGVVGCRGVKGLEYVRHLDQVWIL